MTQWQRPIVGFEYDAQVLSVSRDWQREKLAACGTDAAVFGQNVDPAFFIGLSIDAGIQSGISAQGNVNMVQRLTVHRCVAFEEELCVHGRIVAVDAVPRGERISSEVWFEDSRGETVISANRTSLRPDPNRVGVRGAGERAAPVFDERISREMLADYQLTPQCVCDYSMEGNSIHYDEAAATAAGFPAPLIGGGMGVHYLTAQIWRHGTPDKLDLELYFRRPIFWNESLQVVCAGRAAEPQGWLALGLMKADKIATEARINQLDYAKQDPGDSHLSTGQQ